MDRDSLEPDVNPTKQPVLPPRTGESNVEHYGANAGQSTEVRVRHSDVLGPEYNMSHDRLGKALIINNIRFQSETLPDRTGSDKDAANIYQRFQELGFDVDLLTDVTFNEILEKFREIAETDHSDSDCFFCAIMSHGDVDGIWATDRTIDLNEILKTVNSTNCPSLLGKPKVFFIQCCRGSAVDTGCVARVARDETVSDALADYTYYTPDTSSGEDVIVVPNDMDFLISYSSVDGKYSFRDTELGTPFIITLCKELENLIASEEEMNIYDLLNKVNEGVAINFQTREGEKQMPTFHSRLRKPFKIRKKIYN